MTLSALRVHPVTFRATWDTLSLPIGDGMKKLIKLAMVVGAITVAARLVGSKKAEWEGLTEPEVRGKIDARMPERVPDGKRTMVADQVVAAMRSRGKLVEDETSDDDDGTVESDSDE